MRDQLAIGLIDHAAEALGSRASHDVEGLEVGQGHGRGIGQPRALDRSSGSGHRQTQPALQNPSIGAKRFDDDKSNVAWLDDKKDVSARALKNKPKLAAK